MNCLRMVLGNLLGGELALGAELATVPGGYVQLLSVVEQSLGQQAMVG